MAWGPFNAGGGGGSSGGTAADISYDNSKSGISAANVQEAIDALWTWGNTDRRLGCTSLKITNCFRKFT